MRKICRFLLLLPVALLLSACSDLLAGDLTPPPGSEQRFSTEVPLAASGPVYPLLPPDPQAGASIFLEQCASCHGVQGGGDGSQATLLTVPVAPLSATARQATLAEWYTLVSQGNVARFMPPFPDLTERQKWDVVAYAYTLSVSPAALTQGQALYAQNCAACHGEQGRGDGPQAANLAQRPADLTSQALLSARSDADLHAAIGSGVAPVMPAFAETLGDEQRWALAAYLRSLTFAAAPQATAYPLPGAVAPAPTAERPPLPTGSVQVQVTNGSGTLLPDELPVTLFALDETSIVFSHTLQTGADGLYTFSDVEIPPGRAFVAAAEHAGGMFFSAMGEAGELPADLALQVVVYDASTDASVLTVDRIHILIQFLDARTVQVAEVFTISNPTNRVVVAPEPGGAVTFFPLPEGATNLYFQDSALGERYLEVPGGFADTTAVEPGLAAYQVVVAFDLPYDRKLEFSQPLNMTTDALLVLLPDVGVKLRSDLLQEDAGRDFQGMPYRVYRGEGVSAGGQFTFDLSGSPKLSSPAQLTPDVTRNLAIGLLVFGAAVLATGIWLYRSSKAEEAAAAALALPETETLPDDPERLMDAIIALDDLHQAGSLQEEEYQFRRSALKTRLKSRLGQ